MRPPHECQLLYQSFRWFGPCMTSPFQSCGADNYAFTLDAASVSSDVSFRIFAGRNGDNTISTRFPIWQRNADQTVFAEASDKQQQKKNRASKSLAKFADAKSQHLFRLWLSSSSSSRRGDHPAKLIRWLHVRFGGHETGLGDINYVIAGNRSRNRKGHFGVFGQMMVPTEALHKNLINYEMVECVLWNRQHILGNPFQDDSLAAFRPASVLLVDGRHWMGMWLSNGEKRRKPPKLITIAKWIKTSEMRWDSD